MQRNSVFITTVDIIRYHNTNATYM